MAIIKELLVNGSTRPVSADTDRTLLSVLRDDLSLTGCKYGCGEGQCGACTVLVDGQPTRSCTKRVGTAEGKPIRTVEGLSAGDRLHPLQLAFMETGAFQCGYCTPGILMGATALLSRNPEPDRDEIVRFMNGHICRCGLYPQIVTAIEKAARAMKGGAK